MSGLKIVWIACLLAVTGWVQGQSVPLELRGHYVGTGKLTNYESGQVTKEKYSATLFVEETEWTLIVTKEGGGFPEEFVGPTAAIGSYLFGRGTLGSATFGGRLQVKGKVPVKHSLAGTMSLAYGDFWGVGDLALKLKKSPL